LLAVLPNNPPVLAAPNAPPPNRLGAALVVAVPNRGLAAADAPNRPPPPPMAPEGCAAPKRLGVDATDVAPPKAENIETEQ